MNTEEFKKYLETKTDKLAELRNKEIISQLKFSMKDFIEIIIDVLTDEEKVQFLTSFTKIAQSYKENIIKSITSDQIKLEILGNNDFQKYSATEIIETLTDKGKISLLHNRELIEKYQLNAYDLNQVIYKMSNEAVEQLLQEKELMLKLFETNSSYYISKIILKVQDENQRFLIAEEYELDKAAMVFLTCTSSEEKKQEILLSEKYELGKYTITEILSYFSTQNLITFYQENGEFWKKHEIKIHQVVKLLSDDKQLEFVSYLDSIDLNLDDKLKSLVVLSKDTKAQIDRTGLDDIYIQALEMPVITSDDKIARDSGYIDIDLEGDLTQYRGYDELIRIRPQEVPFEKHDRLIELARICPNLEVHDNLDLTSSTAQEFINAEEWISDVILHIEDDWTDIQKVAYIDYRIGKKISYTPDFETEVSDDASARALWRIIDSEYGVCNGISQVEQYLLKHVGIESELVSSGKHAFLKLPNIEIPRKDGTMVRGDTIIDSTWNLASHRYDAYPNLLARSYSEIRKFDIDVDGNDRECHKNDEKLSSATIDIEEDALRQVFASIGIAKADGTFYIGDMMEKSNEIAAKNISLEQKTKEQLELLREMHPDFYKCQNSTISILARNILKHDEMNYRKLVVNRVYDRTDKDKRPLLYVYCKMKEEKEQFYVADPTSKSFVKMDLESFIEKYECYEKDMDKAGGIRPWEKGAKQVEEDLAKSSGKIVSQEKTDGDER